MIAAEAPPALGDGAGPVARLGHATMLLCHDVGGLVVLAMAVARGVFLLRIDRRELVRQLDRFCLQVMPLMLGGSVIVGGVVAMQGLGYIDRYNATEVYGWAAALSSYREVGPLLLGMVLASRVGAKNTAELATMLARERLDALVALGLDPHRVVVAPRAVAIGLSAAILFPLASTTIFLSSVLIAAVVGDQLLAVSWYSMVEYTHASEVLEGFLRMSLFGGLIGVCSSAYGLRSGRDARAIGRSVYASSVASMSSLVVVNLYLSFLSSR